MIVGAMLAASDLVAVLAGMKELGADPSLFMIISLESVIDGCAAGRDSARGHQRKRSPTQAFARGCVHCAGAFRVTRRTNSNLYAAVPTIKYRKPMPLVEYVVPAHHT